MAKDGNFSSKPRGGYQAPNHHEPMAILHIQMPLGIMYYYEELSDHLAILIDSEIKRNRPNSQSQPQKFF